jgi:membrane fusion protein (multidrug efflux system)
LSPASGKLSDLVPPGAAAAGTSLGQPAIATATPALRKAPQAPELPLQVPPPDGPAPGRRLLAYLWELIGLALVVLVLFLVLSWLLQAIGAKSEALRQRNDALRAAAVKPPVDVAVLPVQPVAVRDTIRLPGLIQASRDVTVSAQVSGTVLHGKHGPVAEGTRVQAGAELLRIDPEDARIAVERARTALKDAQLRLERTRDLRRQQATAQSELDAAAAAYDLARIDHEAALLDLERCTLRSPIDGVVETVFPEPGELLSRGDPVATVLDLDRVEVEIGIPEKDVDAVAGLTEAVVAVEALGSRFVARKTYLGSAPVDRTLVYRLRLEADNPGHRLRPGMFVEAELVRAERPASVLVPLYCVIARDGGHEVYVVQEAAGQTGLPPGQGAPRQFAERRQVQLGVIQGQQVEIRSGLRAGDRLIVLGQRSVQHGTAVTVTRSVRDLQELLR